MPTPAFFPKAITTLPEAEVPMGGVRAYLSQGDDHQVVFMEFEGDVKVPAHSHGDQWAVVVAGRIDLVIGGAEWTLRKGDSYFVPAGVEHSASVSAGYAEVAFFADRARYRTKGGGGA